MMIMAAIRHDEVTSAADINDIMTDVPSRSKSFPTTSLRRPSTICVPSLSNSVAACRLRKNLNIRSNVCLAVSLTLSLLLLATTRGVAADVGDAAQATAPKLDEPRPEPEGLVCPTSKRFYSPDEQKPLTMLYSFEGSGNTWTRYLLENSTGIYTGCIYRDKALVQSGFLGEAVRDNTVLAIKSHWHHCQNKPEELEPYDKIIHLIRNPLEALVAERKRRISGSHTRSPSWDAFAAGKPYTRSALENKHGWDHWIHHVGVPYYNGTQIHAIKLKNLENTAYYRLHYEDLKRDVVSALSPVLEFLDFDPQLAHCPLRAQKVVRNRPKQDGWPECPYTREQLQYITEKLEWTMKENNHGIPKSCQAVWDGTELGGTDAVPASPELQASWKKPRIDPTSS